MKSKCNRAELEVLEVVNSVLVIISCVRLTRAVM